jgi:hypothetical protein
VLTFSSRETLVESSGDVKVLNMGASDVMITWVNTPCESIFPVGLKNGSSNGDNHWSKWGLDLGASDVLGT